MEMPNKIGEIDIWPPVWFPAFGKRIFQFDVFLSHNRSDGSELLSQQLQQKGINCWYDESADLENENVREVVERAINASRFVMVCVKRNFRESAWIRAEYEPVLQKDQFHQLDRMMVAVQKGGRIPTALQGCRCFNWDDLDGIASFVRTGNFLPFDPERLSKRPIPIGADQPPQHDASILDSILKFSNELDNDEYTSSFIKQFESILDAPGWFVEDLKDESQFLEAIQLDTRKFIEDKAELMEKMAPILRFVAWAGHRSGQFANRSNAIAILLHLSRLPSWKKQMDSEIVTMLARENAESILNQIGEWLQTVETTDEETSTILQYTAIRAPYHFRCKEAGLVSRFPQSIRARIFGMTDIKLISNKERILLLSRQLEAILGGIQASRPESLTNPHGLALHVEAILREANIIGRGADAGPDSNVASQALFELHTMLISKAEEFGGPPLTWKGIVEVIPGITIRPLWSLKSKGLDPDMINELIERTLKLLADPKNNKRLAHCFEDFQKHLAQSLDLKEVMRIHRKCMAEVLRFRDS